MVEIPTGNRDFSRFLPKNLSYEGGSFHRAYYSAVPSSRRMLKMDPLGPEVNIDRTPKSLDCADSSDVCRERSPSLQSTSTSYSEDYTMTDVEGSEVGDLSCRPPFRTPAMSVSSDDFSETADGDDLFASGSFSTKLAMVSDSCKNIPQLAHRGHDLISMMSLDSLELLSPDDLADTMHYVTLNDIAEQPSKGYEGFHGDGEFDFLRTERVQRSRSLKTSKTPPGTPRRKKAVRFADALGLDLESVRHILNNDAPPKIPASATKGLRVSQDEEPKNPGNKYLSACFRQPGADPHFLERVRDDKVALENCLVDDRAMTVTGTVRVSSGVSYHKRVALRYSASRWQSQADVQASYIQNSYDGVTDRFSFSINVPQYFTTGSRLEFAVMFTAGGQVYWDNNNGNNYAVLCYAQSMPDEGKDNSWLHFL